MKPSSRLATLAANLATGAVLVLASRALETRADEGMWLYNQPPADRLRQRHAFEITPEWLTHLRMSSVRFMSGGSGSFVSEDGLVLSNHHVGADALQKLSTTERDLLRDGFHARNLAEELPCKDLELNVLVEIEDVTARVNAAVPADAPPEKAATARRAILAEIEQESSQKTGLRSDVVTLFQGGAYHLYRYKRYTDVRLVFAPEQQIAFFGGDPDNFEYPRFCLDIAFFRAYEDGKPAKTPHFLRWSTAGVREDELVFVSGHPGRTSRLLTVAELEYLRDRTYPETLERLNREEVNLLAWSGRSAENARRAKDELFGVQNSRKARIGGLAGLQDPAFFGKIAAAETEFRARLGTSSEFEPARSAFDRIAAAQRVLGEHAVRYRMLEGAWGLRGELFSIARTLLRNGEEAPKPSRERLREFRDSNRTSLELALFSTQPIHADFETVLLSDSLTFLATRLGANDPLVRTLLAGKSPRARAAEVVTGPRVGDVATRRRLYEGGSKAVAEAADPMIELARAVDAEARRIRTIVEEQDEVKQQAHAAIARARFALQGSGTYPDATFTLRLAYGQVKRFEEDGREVPAFTDFAGLFARSESQHGQPPFDLPPRWMKRGNRLARETPFNFVSTADIIGGNSGSPTVNRAGEFVGIIFDGNLASLVLDFAFDDVRARALSVDSRGILEALKKVYDARNLVEELGGRGIRRR
ncbi:MAG: S46 family peptidase [Verrucomicrobiales bacterium]|nr:S46 family peptidase [Verrucomicrobiales bacterium]